MNAERQKEEQLTLDVLSAIDAGGQISQRSLSRQMGVALGLTNSYIKRCVRKGYVKVSEAPANRYLYYLTPKGVREKSRLVARFLTRSLDFYRTAAESCERVYMACREDGVDAVILCGHSELAEIALLKSMETRVLVEGLYDVDFERPKFYSRSVWRELENAPPVPRLLTRIEGAERLLTRLKKQAPGVPVYVPDVLGLDPKK